MKIYTRGGDAGETALLGGVRVPKHHARIAAYGTIDELNAALGSVRATDLPREIDRVIERVQHELFALGAELAAPEPQTKAELITENHVQALEIDIDSFEGQLPELTCFILPAGPPQTAALHVARCVCRRAERHLVALAETAAVRATALMYVNRLSDLLFVAARLATKSAGGTETPWNKDC